MISRSIKPIARSPLKWKPRKKKPGHNPLFLAWVHTIPCFICFLDLYLNFSAEELVEIFQSNPITTEVEAAHLGRSTSRRGLNQKYPDNESGPLCVGHHTGFARSLHSMGPHFWEWHGVNRDELIDKLQEMFEVSKGL